MPWLLLTSHCIHRPLAVVAEPMVTRAYRKAGYLTMVIAGYIPANSQLAAAIATHGKRLKYGKIAKCFSKTGGNYNFEKKMLNYLSFLVLLYVSGHFQQKKFFQNFSD